MRELHLPENATERDLELAEHVARAFESHSLHVCWSECGGTSPTARIPAAPGSPFGVLIGELAGGLAALWEAMVAGLERAGRAP
jgi:hypothetical protein